MGLMLRSKVRAALRSGGLLRRILGNSGWLLLERVVKAGIGLAIAVWLARFLGPESFGAYNFAIAFVLLFSELTTLGLNGIVTRDVVEEPESLDSVLGTAFGLRAIGGVAGVAATAVTIWLLRPDDLQIQVLVLIYASATLFRALEVVDLFFQARLQARVPVIARIAATVVYAATTAAFILAEMPLLWFMTAKALELVVMNLGFLILYAVGGWDARRWRFVGGRATSMLRQSWPLVISGFGATINLKIDQVMLGQMSGDRSVGIYVVAAQLSEVWFFIPIALMGSLFPVLVDSRRRDRAEYRDRLQLTYDVFAWMAIAIAAGVTLVAPWVIRFLYGDPYAAASTILAVHIWGAVFIFMRAVLSKWLIMERLFIFSLVTHGFGAIANVAANLLLIPHYDGLGAAYATLISYAGSSFFALWLHPATWPAAAMMSRALIAPARWMRAAWKARG